MRLGLHMHRAIKSISALIHTKMQQLLLPTPVADNLQSLRTSLMCSRALKKFKQLLWPIRPILSLCHELVISPSYNYYFYCCYTTLYLVHPQSWLLLLNDLCLSEKWTPVPLPVFGGAAMNSRRISSAGWFHMWFG